MNCIKSSGVDSIKDEWEKLFTLKTKFATWEHQEWVQYVREHGNGTFVEEWLDYIHDRYDM